MQGDIVIKMVIFVVFASAQIMLHCGEEQSERDELTSAPAQLPAVLVDSIIHG